MNGVGSAKPVESVAAKVRYVNAEWKDRGEIPRIGSRENGCARVVHCDCNLQPLDGTPPRRSIETRLLAVFENARKKD